MGCKPPRSCKEIAEQYERDYRALNDRYNEEMRQARNVHFPIGTRVTFPHGLKTLRGIIVKHGEFNWNGDEVTIRTKSGAEHKKKANELTHDDEDETPIPKAR